MKKTLSILLGFILIFSLGLASLMQARPARAAATTYVFATFHGDAAADEKLWIYTSSDGVNFSLFSNTGFGGPTGVLRDPSIMKYSDGKYYIGFTIQSWTTASTSFAAERDLTLLSSSSLIV